jgi:hypothetical protein
LECLGSSLQDFFSEEEDEPVVFKGNDYFVKEMPEEGYAIHWVVPNSIQAGRWNPSSLRSSPAARLWEDDSPSGRRIRHGTHSGSMYSCFSGKSGCVMKKGDCFYFKPDRNHGIKEHRQVCGQRCCGYHRRRASRPGLHTVDWGIVMAKEKYIIELRNLSKSYDGMSRSLTPSI